MSELWSDWTLTVGSRPMLVGRIQTYSCEPHLHDTFTIAYMRRGTAHVNVRGRPWVWQRGEVFLGNPYEVHAGGNTDATIEYDVYYPNIELLLECAGRSRNTDCTPRFRTAVLKDPIRVHELTEVLGSAQASAEANGKGSAAIEADLCRFFRGNPDLIYSASAEEIAPIREACRILQQSVDSRIRWADLPRQVGCSRPHFIRLFHKTTGLAPNAYFRQLRLGKALRLICSGESIAAAAADSGFTDQAHLTREFKRTFGRTPGKIAHDIVDALQSAAD